MNALQDLIKTYASQYKEQVVEWRRHIHSHPELSGEEKNTSLFIQKVLGELEIPFVNDVSDYAVIGKIEGAHTGPVIALRADMDALPIHEITGLPFASQNEGVMHACGHDSHMAILLGAAAILQSIKDQLHGTVKLVFQPSEEEALFPGAQGIVDSGILDDVDEIYGLHVWPQLPVGTVGLKKGNLMAASDHFLVHIKGKATHGAEPHNGVDAIVAAANWIVNVESMVARETNPMENLVCTIGVINGGDRYNVGCGDVYLEGTCRTYEPEKRDYIERRLGESLQALDMLLKTKSTLDYKRGHGATINNPNAIDYVTSIVEKYLGKEAVVHPEFPSMAAEDFSAYLDLYYKYRDDYGVEEILAGQVKPAVYARLLNAPFDERLSLVSLILSGLNTRFTASRQADAVADACYAFLREAKQGFSTLPADIPDGELTLFGQMVTDYDAETQRQRAAGLLSHDALNTRLQVYAALRSWDAELRRANAVSTQPAFDLLRTQFQSLAEARDQAQEAASAALEAAFDFMENAFAESQEMVVFVTELTLNPASHAFITENGCDRYFRYNKDLLLDHRKAALQQELTAEARRHGGQ